MEKEQKPKKKKTLLPLGLILLFGGFVVNATFMYFGVLGYLREMTRLATIVGLLLILVGLVQMIVKLINRKAK
jgi:ABC-type multidrug transport system permease subunit